MQTQTITINIKGMHCKSCELLIEDELAAIKNVQKVSANSQKSLATITFTGTLNQKQISLAIKKAGYELANPADAKNDTAVISLTKEKIINLFFATAIVGLLIWLLGKSEFINNSLAVSPTASNLGVVLAVGLTAGISTCMAIVGGLVLAATAKYNQSHPQASFIEKFKPQLFFNLGRVLGFFVLGGLLGLAGSALQLSLIVTGILTIVVGITMLILGVQLLDIFPWINGIKLTLPKSLSKGLGINHHDQEYNHYRTLIMGALTFFLPCGFTQTMQLLAVHSGSFTQGALIMSVFAIGTVPGLLGIGGLISAIKGRAAQVFFAASGIIVILLSVINILNGANLMGLPTPIFFNPPSVRGQTINSNESNQSEQIIEMTQQRNGYSPSNFTVKKNVPVTWIINSIDSYSCASSLVLPKLNIKQFLQPGQNIIKFTPTEVGTLKFSCSMGMYTGSIKVID